MRALRAFAIRLLLDFDVCYEAVRVWYSKRIRGGVAQPAARAQPSTQAKRVMQRKRHHYPIIL